MLRRKLVPGENLNRAISASTWNDLLSLLDHRDRNGLWSPPRQVYGGDFERSAKACEVWVQNNSGYDLDQFAVCGIDTPLCDSSVATGEFKREVTFSVSTPGASPSGKFVVLKDAIPNGQCGKAVVAGATQARVDISDDTHEFCDAETGNLSTLASGSSGSAQILWKQQDSGDAVWCIVRLSNEPPAGGPPSCILWSGEAYNSDFTGDLVYRDVADAANRWCYLFWDKAWGDLVGTSVAAINTATTPGAFDNPSFETQQAGLYRFDLRIDLSHDTAQPGYDVVPTSTSTVSGHSHSVDLRFDNGYWQIAGLILEHKDGAGAWTYSAVDNWYINGITGTSLPTGAIVGEPISTNATWWQMHNYPGRRYRIQVWLSGEHPTDDNIGYVFYPILQVTRLGDYAADQTL